MNRPKKFDKTAKQKIGLQIELEKSKNHPFLESLLVVWQMCSPLLVAIPIDRIATALGDLLPT